MDRLVALAKRGTKKVSGSDAQQAQRLLKALAENDKSVTSVEIGASEPVSAANGPGESFNADSGMDSHGNMVSSSHLDTTLACGLIRAIEDNRYVSTLTIKGRTDSGELIPAVASLLHHSHALTYFHMSDMHIGDDMGMVLLGALAKNLSITTAVLTNLGLTTTEGVSMLLKHNETMTCLDLSYNDFGGKGDEAFAELAESFREVTSTKLTEIRFAHTHLSDASLNRICCVLEESTDFCPALRMLDFGSGESEVEANGNVVASGDGDTVTTSIGSGNSRYTILEFTRQRLLVVLNKRRNTQRRNPRRAAAMVEQGGDALGGLASVNVVASQEVQALTEEVASAHRRVAEMQKSLDAAHAETLVWKKKQQSATKEMEDALKRVNQFRTQASEAASLVEEMGADKARSLEESGKEVQEAYRLVSAMKSQLEKLLKAHNRLRGDHAAVVAEREVLNAECVALRDEYNAQLQAAILQIASLPSTASGANNTSSGDAEALLRSSMGGVDISTQTDQLSSSSARDRKLSFSYHRNQSSSDLTSSPQKRPQMSGFGTNKFGAYDGGDNESFENIDAATITAHYASAPQLEPGERPKWKDDKYAPNCAHCQREFTLLVRRHHCRRCGDVYCDRCCSKSRLHDNERICAPCASVPLQLTDL